MPKRGTMKMLPTKIPTAANTVFSLCTKAHASKRWYTPLKRSVVVSNQPVIRPIDLSYQFSGLVAWPRIWMLGSCQTLESMGSRVKLTNIEISTATTMVKPNSWKNFPITPSMNPMGKNTATIEKVVASTARPISLVPSMAAVNAFLPICTWRTMFSRTTMASSISKPMHSDKAMRVIILMVKPNKLMNKKVPITAIGKASPVMMVERQEFKNKNTINTVSKAPSMRVFCTLLTATRMGLEPSKIGSRRTPGGSCLRMDSMVSIKPSTTSMVFSSWALTTDNSRVRCPL